MKKLVRKIKLNFPHFSQDASKSGFGSEKMNLDPSPNVGVCCYSVRVSVIVKTCNKQRIYHLLWSEFRIITQTLKFWKKSRVKLIYSNYCAAHLLNKFPIFPSTNPNSGRSVKNGIAPLFHIHFFHPQIQISARFWKKWSWTPTGCISVYDSLCVWT